MNSHLRVDMELRFQLPTEVLPFDLERARLVAKIHAPSREVTIAGKADGKPVAPHRVENPLDPIRIDFTEKSQLKLDEGGGLHVYLAISDSNQDADGGPEDSKAVAEWTIEYLEVEITGVSH
jgi:hypothetical protein